MRLYHGTNTDFDQIDLLKSKPNKDFGRGFYLSHDYDQALNMGLIKTKQQRYGTPIVLEFEIQESELEMLRVLRFDSYSEQWAKFILDNRRNPNSTPIHDYDVVIGPIANDRVGAQLWRYENQLIDLQTLMMQLKYMKGITIQYFFGTDRAVSLLKRIK